MSITDSSVKNLTGYLSLRAGSHAIRAAMLSVVIYNASVLF